MNRSHRPMGQRRPVALSLLGLFSVPGAFAQQATPQTPATPPAQVQPAPQSDTQNAARPPATGAAVPPTLREVQIKATTDNSNFGANQNSISRLPADLHDIPQSITVINQAVMQSQGATSLASALRNVPGLTIGGAEGGQIGTNINLNGFSARTDVFLDGARDRAQYYRDTFALDSIEVLMGPSSMLFGRGSTGGVINQVTKKPTLKAADEVQVSASTTGLVRTTLDHNQPLSDTAAFRVAVMGQQGNATTRDQTELQDFGIAPSLKLGIGTPTEITLTGLLQHNRDMPDYGVAALNGAPVKVNPKTAYGFTDDRTISDIGALGVLVEHKLTPTSSIRNQTQYNNVITDARETAPHAIGTLTAAGFVPLSMGTTAVPAAATSTLPLSQLWVEQQSHDRVIHDTSLFNLTEFSTKFETGTVKHALLAGFELGRDTYNNQNYYRNGSCNGIALNPAGGTSGYTACTPLLDPAQTTSPGAAPSVAGNLATASATSVAGYFNDTLELSPQFKLVGGLRQDRYSASIGNSMPTATTLATANQTVNFTSVRAGGIWQPTEAQSYYLSYSTSFNPSLEQLVSTTGSSQPLPPTTNKAYEAGGKWDLNGGNLSLSAAAFQITQDNARSQNPDGSYSATGTVRVNGARAGAAGRVTDRLQIFGGYTHLDALIVNGVAPGTNGMVPANTPKDSASLWSTYAITPQWEVGAGATYSSSRFANNTDLVQVGAYTRWDAMLAYHQPKYDIRLNVFNLFNTNYYDALIPSDGGRAVPGLGRSATVSVAYRF
ncbi:MAG: TonB-dependent siderophore receptor [Rhodoferax sp.]|nr:TonB-dependent siderophore receptor [Rhodoferax sp.]